MHLSSSMTAFLQQHVLTSNLPRSYQETERLYTLSHSPVHVQSMSASHGICLSRRVCHLHSASLDVPISLLVQSMSINQTENKGQLYSQIVSNSPSALLLRRYARVGKSRLLERCLAVTTPKVKRMFGSPTTRL